MMMLSDPRASTSQLQTLICVRLDQQKKAAQNHIAELDKDKTFSGPIATEVVPLKHFYPRGRLSSRLFASEVSVHRLQRPAQGEQAARGVSKPLQPVQPVTEGAHVSPRRHALSPGNTAHHLPTRARATPPPFKSCCVRAIGSVARGTPRPQAAALPCGLGVSSCEVTSTRLVLPTKRTFRVIVKAGNSVRHSNPCLSS